MMRFIDIFEEQQTALQLSLYHYLKLINYGKKENQNVK